MMRRLLDWAGMRSGVIGSGDLRAVAMRLTATIRSAERDFLSVGGKLGEFLGRARCQATALEEMPRSLGEDQGEELVAALDEVQEWAAGAGHGTGCGEALAAVIEDVKSASAPLGDLDHTVRMLRVMGVMTRVESARLGLQGAGFEALAGEVAAMASAIEEKSAGVGGALEELRRLLAGTGATESAIDQKQHADLLKLVSGCGAGIAGLRTWQKQVASASADAQAGFEQLGQEIGQVVEAIQSHDSTRQRIEHIGEALAELAARLDRKERLAAVAAGVGLQAAQLAESRRQFTGAVAGIRADLGRMAEAAAGFARTARDLAGNGGGGSLAGSLEGHYRAVGAALEGWAGARRKLAASAQEAGESCQKVSAWVSEIEGVGERALRLALNAEVQAARLAADGVVMEAVATGIRGVSQAATEHAAAASRSLGGVARSVERLTAELGLDRDTAFQRAAALGSRIGDLAVSLQGASAAAARLLASVGEGGESLAREIGELGQALAADRAMEETCGACLETLARAASGAREGAPGSGRPPAAQSTLVHAAHKYTMHAERKVHREFAAPAAAAAPPQEPPPAAAGEFGENVEMF